MTIKRELALFFITGKGCSTKHVCGCVINGTAMWCSMSLGVHCYIRQISYSAQLSNRSKQAKRQVTAIVFPLKHLKECVCVGGGGKNSY